MKVRIYKAHTQLVSKSTRIRCSIQIRNTNKTWSLEIMSSVLINVYSEIIFTETLVKRTKGVNIEGDKENTTRCMENTAIC